MKETQRIELMSIGILNDMIKNLGIDAIRETINNKKK